LKNPRNNDTQRGFKELERKVPTLDQDAPKGIEISGEKTVKTLCVV